MHQWKVEKHEKILICTCKGRSRRKLLLTGRNMIFYHYRLGTEPQAEMWFLSNVANSVKLKVLHYIEPYLKNCDTLSCFFLFLKSIHCVTLMCKSFYKAMSWSLTIIQWRSHLNVWELIMKKYGSRKWTSPNYNTLPSEQQTVTKLHHWCLLRLRSTTHTFSHIPQAWTKPQ